MNTLPEDPEAIVECCVGIIDKKAVWIKCKRADIELIRSLPPEHVQKLTARFLAENPTGWRAE